MENPESIASCTRCGAVVPGGTQGCQRLFQEILALEYSETAYGAIHLLSVDAYALRHCEDHRPRSNAIYLIHLCMLLEHNATPRLGWNPDWFANQIENDQEILFLEPPEDCGEITVADVRGLSTPEEHAERVHHWVGSVWAAWDEYHEWARQWLR